MNHAARFDWLLARGCLAAVGLAAPALRAQQDPPTPTFTNVTVHDPSIVRDGSTFYVFGSHLASASTTDLMNWTQITTSPVAPNSLIRNGTPLVEFAAALAYAGNATTFWAPDVIKLGDGQYHFYYCACQGTSPLSALGLAKADAITGPYANVGLLLNSAGGTPTVAPYDVNTMPNVVDPSVFFDHTGKLWMVYGSFSGGIFILQLDSAPGSPTIGQPLAGQGYGKKLIGGNSSRIEGPYIIYSPETSDYYLFMTFGGLDAAGGYNIRVGRSPNPDGPYLDAIGNDLTNVKGNFAFDDATIAPYGVKLMGNYQFLHVTGEPGATSRGYVSPGGTSVYRDPATGKYFLVFHTRFVGRGEEHEVRVHQMFINTDGWPVVAPQRYAGETISATDLGRVVGTYKLINHGKDITTTVKTSTLITLQADYSVSGSVVGTWQVSGEHDFTLALSGVIYRGALVRQWDDDSQVWVLAFTALSDNGTAWWGSKVAINTAPAILTDPVSQTVLSGTDITLTAVASGDPAPTYQWKKNNAAINGATGGSYLLSSVTTGDAGSYTVVATNSVGSATSNAAVLTVNPATSAPSFTVHPQSQTVTAGGTVTFTAAATGNPAPTFQWQKNGSPIGGATGSSYSIASVVPGDAGTYTLVATNSVGSVMSNAATLAVNVAPAFTLQPQSQAVTAGNLVTFTAAASGIPTPTYQWKKDGGNISNANGSSYTIASVAPGDLGAYTVVATNSAGSTTSNAATLVFSVAPAITTQPVSQAVMASSSVTFTVVANGIPDPTYQWRKNGVNIPDATGSSLVIGAASEDDIGTYAAVATNAAGTATSNGVTLAVQAAAFNLASSLWMNPPAGLCNLWLMNGTTFNSGASLGPVPAAWRVVAATDFNGDGQADIVWQNTATGQRRIWLMNGTALGSEVDLGTYDPAWQIVTAVDFDGDGQSDILWQNIATGQRTIWLMNGTSYLSAVDFGIYEVSWQIVTAVDFNGDGFPDILWQNKVTGQRTIWLMHGTTYSGAVDFGNYDIRWQMMTAADFNGDGHPDILWQNAATGQRTIWLMFGTVYNGAVSLGAQNPRWRAAAVGDFNGDGQSDILWQADPAAGDFNGDGHHDILWQNSTDGRRTIWLMNGPTYMAQVDLGPYDVNWQIVTAVDFDGDGQSDILWQNSLTGQRRIWLMHGSTFGAEVSFGTYDVSWQMVAAADFNADGHPDILWQNTVTGQRIIWLMNGTTYLSVVDFGTYDPSWQIVTAADFDGDGQPDILWQNTATGRRTIWLMNGTTFGSAVDFGTYDTNWQMVAAADYNDDGQADILWQNTVTGQRTIWLMNGTTFGSAVDFGIYDVTWQMRN